LLDTHTFLYAIRDPQKLTPRMRKLLTDSAIPRWVSVVSLWEIAIKVRIGRLSMPGDQAFYQRHLGHLRAQALPVELRHSLAMFELPLHHKDPFDRLLIAQARAEDLTLATRDAAFAAYALPTIW
jgi:PIN domain nuclease of toxin-antitoxin system